jgi:hypothetical protein
MLSWQNTTPRSWRTARARTKGRAHSWLSRARSIRRRPHGPGGLSGQGKKYENEAIFFFIFNTPRLKRTHFGRAALQPRQPAWK